MAFITYPLNNIDYTAEDAELFHCTRTSGIWAEDSFPISVTGADNNVTIGTGIAWINNKEFSGKVAALKSAEVLDLGIADSTYPRIDVVAIQFNANNNATDIIIKKGTPATNPVRPSIVKTGAIYELYLASIYRPAGATAITASNVTDLRMDETVCGLMADSVTKVDMTAIEAQVRAFIDNLQSEIDSIRNLEGIMFESEWVEGGVIPVSKGGTGKNTHTLNSVLTGNGTNAVKNVVSANGAFYATGTNGVPKFGTLPVAQGGTGVTTNAAIGLKAYPVGAVYISYNSTSPAELFGGTWTPITGVFPYFNAGTAKGGSNTHTLTIAEMPSHNHKEAGWNISYKDGISKVAASGSAYSWGANNGYSTDATGGGGAHNNMPAYQTFYAWRRTA